MCIFVLRIKTFFSSSSPCSFLYSLHQADSVQCIPCEMRNSFFFRLDSSLRQVTLMEIRFNNLPALRSVQQEKFNDAVVQMQFSSYAVNR